MAARGRWAEFESEAGPLRMLNHPMNISGLPKRTAAVPSIGQHTTEVLAELGF